jgi:hypothetical protein
LENPTEEVRNIIKMDSAMQLKPTAFRFIRLVISLILLIMGFGSVEFVSAEGNRVFIHPGAVNNKADLKFVKAKIRNGEQPWTTMFKQVNDLATSGGKPLLDINSKSEDANISMDDARRAYANALVWSYTGKEVYAKQAILILNGWSELQSFNGGNDQDKLHAGWVGSLFGSAAEIMRGYRGWARSDKRKLQAMFKRAFYPQLLNASSWNGNVDLTQIDAMMNIAVFNDDEMLFNRGIERLNRRIPSYFFLKSDKIVPAIEGDGGNVAAFWNNPTSWIDGLTQETCRDNGHHTQFALASAIRAAEVAWNQGVDLYTPHAARLSAAMELLASQINTANMQGTCPNNTATSSLFNTWEVGFNHYHYRKGKNLPQTEKLIKEKVRLKSSSVLNIFYETLTHAEVGRK